MAQHFEPDSVTELQARLAAIIESSDDAILSKNLDGVIESWNQGATKLYGYSAEEMIGRPLSVLVPADRTGELAWIMDHIRRGESVDRYETQRVCKDGSVVDVSITVSPVRDAKGTIVAASTIARNIAERKQAQRELERANERFAKAFHSGPGAQVIVRVADSRILDVNEQFERLFGYSRDEVVGQVSNVYPFYADPKQLAEAGRILAEGGAVSNYEVTIATKSGEQRDTLMWIEWIEVEGEQCVFGYHVDITDRKRVEEMERINQGLAEATRLKSEFLANMSHELRTPLNAIIGFSEVLQDETFGPLNPRQQRYVGNVLSSGQHLLALVNDILDISKIEAGRMELHREELELASLLYEVRERMQPLVERKQQQLHLELPANAIHVDADRSRLIQILLNLLSNAVKFTPEHGTITVDCRLDGRQVAIAVSDTGIGIAAADLSRIFDEFEQIDSSVGRTQQGTGLGLTLTRQLVELHGGTISVASEVGVGSTFTVLLPAVAQEARPRGSLGTVLVVEDDPHARELLQLTLGGEGYSVEWVERIDDVISRARELQPVAITLDLVLGDALSWPALQKLKADPATRHIPVVIISILDEEEIGLALGASAYLTKPVSRQALLDTVASLAERLEAPERGLRILTVDDDPVARQLVVLALEGTPHQVVQAASGKEALDLLTHAPFDLVIVDLMMEPMSGFELIEALAERPDMRGVPVVVLTALELSSADIRRLNGSIAATLSKTGFTRRHFLRELRRVTGIESEGEPASAD